LVCGARVRALDGLRTPYTMFLDSDAALTAGALPTMVRHLEENPGWGLVSPRLVHDDGTLQRSCRRYPPLTLPLLRRPPLGRWLENGRAARHHLMADFDHDRTRPVLYSIGACHLFRTSLVPAARPFPQIEIGWDDTEWCFRLRDQGAEIVFVHDATVIHSYRRATNRRPVRWKSVRQMANFVDFQRRHWARRRELIALGDELDRRAERAAASAP
jgi:GT2 family glycosyltransferase